MALNLTELIKAAGQAGIAGMSFKTNVVGAADTVRMTDYKISAVAFSGEVPVDDAGTYPNGTEFDLVATFTRGDEAYRIQRNTASAWSVTNWTGPAFSYTITNFSAGGAPTGATHSFRLTITVPPSGSYTVSPTVGMFGSDPGSDDPWPMQWNTNYGGGSGGTALLHIATEYDPDNASFNPLVRNLDEFDNGWLDIPFARPNYAASDYEFEWHTGAGMVRAEWTDAYNINTAPAWDSGSLLNTGATFGTVVTISRRHEVYPDTDPETSLGTHGGDVGVIWLRWRPATGGSWTYPVQSGYGAYPGRWIFYDTRPAV